jgi:hypothetical protein
MRSSSAALPKGYIIRKIIRGRDERIAVAGGKVILCGV